MKITAISYDNAGYKLISMHEEIYRPKFKPLRGPVVMADYKDGLLRLFFENRPTVVRTGTWKQAIKHIFST